MNLAYFLPLGGSLESLALSGQDKRFLEGELSYYLQKFDKIYIFDYSNIKYDTQNTKIVQVCNKSNHHRYIYAFLLPIIQRKIIKSCSVIRVSHLTGMIAGFVAKLIFKKKVVFNYAYDYAKFARYEGKYARSLLLIFFSKLSFIFADGIICANQKYSQMLTGIYGSKAVWIPNGVNTGMFSPEENLKEKNDSIYNILFVGRLAKQKNIINLVEAIHILNNKNIKLTIIGKGGLENEIKHKCKDCKINLELIPKIDNENLPMYYNSCDLFTLPSLAEGSPKVLLEAMSCGSVCLVSDIQENTEIIKNEVNGYVCGQSAKEISDKIKYMMQKIDALRIKKNARETTEKQYAMEIVMKKEVNFVYGF